MLIHLNEQKIYDKVMAKLLEANFHFKQDLILFSVEISLTLYTIHM